MPCEEGETLVCMALVLNKQVVHTSYAYTVMEFADDAITLNNTFSVPLTTDQ